MDLNQILLEALSQEASDVHIKEGAPPIFRVNGVLRPWNKMKPSIIMICRRWLSV